MYERGRLKVSVAFQDNTELSVRSPAVSEGHTSATAFMLRRFQSFIHHWTLHVRTERLLQGGPCDLQRGWQPRGECFIAVYPTLVAVAFKVRPIPNPGGDWIRAILVCNDGTGA